MAYILFILMAWFIQMPLWLSITTTIVAGVGLVAKVVSIVCETLK